ncbi:MAG: hypothetical protein N4A57_07145 [Anaeromicrobium sp.]|jgi:uncharacterized membrane protein|uniref:hypothetical protein n=1 Tax=Anaeromicrobium sp. TaxID=1929132 RepID=UPI0025CDC232|nr:hypothetical protein [Anaeromicrobium sp.]MCT4594025.1 hypothetical protein [Anaeromicrobium sp.]
MKETNKWICVLAYMIFFIPILVDRENEEYRFHANEGLILFIVWVAISIIGSFIPVVGWFVILPVGEFFCLVLAIMDMINGYNEKMKELPIIGKYKLIK